MAQLKEQLNLLEVSLESPLLIDGVHVVVISGPKSRRNASGGANESGLLKMVWSSMIVFRECTSTSFLMHS